MELGNIFALLGGLALFLYGMTMMSNGLEIVAGNRMKGILEKLTSNRFLGIGIGALITALIQSSSATTVMLVGFVNSGLIRLENAVWVIMGANIGTTMTGQLLALKITDLAPLIAFVGVVMVSFFKSQKWDGLGTVLAGLGILFIGMEMMSKAMVPLRDYQPFIDAITSFKNPIIGILAGALFTAVIQSSSASVGILQALATSGLITLPSAIYVLFGQNIGTCITAALASVGTDRNAKRTTALHLEFNIIGTIIFVAISLIFPFAKFVESLTPSNVMAQIANVHTIFNVVTTLLLLPFGKKLVELSYKLLPEGEDKSEETAYKYLNFNLFDNEYHIGSSAMANAQLFREVQHMLSVVNENARLTFELAQEYTEAKWEQINRNEVLINKLNKAIIRFTTLTLSFELPMSGTQAIGLFVKVSSDLERIGDHAMNIAERIQELSDNERQFSQEALIEMDEMNRLIQAILQAIHVNEYSEFTDIVGRVQMLENNVDRAYSMFERAQLVRLKDKKCTVENSIQYAKILTDFERMGDYCLNIAKNFEEVRSTVQSMRLLHDL